MTTSITATRPGRWISIVVLVLGAIGAVFAVGGGVVRGLGAHASNHQIWTTSATGVTAIDLGVAAADVDVRFDDVDEATLEASAAVGPVRSWRLVREGETLRVESERGWHLWNLNGVWWGDDDDEAVTLRLPQDLADDRIALDAEVAGGRLFADGDWGATQLDLSAGSAVLGGSAESLALDVSAGEATLDLATEGTVSIELTAGQIVGALTGAQPTAIDTVVSAGSLELTIPDGSYDVSRSVAAGTAVVDVDERSGAASTIDVQLTAGTVTLRSETR